LSLLGNVISCSLVHDGSTVLSPFVAGKHGPTPVRPQGDKGPIWPWNTESDR
jgi:hypothetical protein